MMTNILEEIIAHKRKEVAAQQEQLPVEALEQEEGFEKATRSLCSHLQLPHASGIIAEFKRKSPSKGFINQKAVAREVAEMYAYANATAISVLTDQQFFGGSTDDFKQARAVQECPMLRKEFIIEEYQIVEAKAIGADAILLIAACLPPDKLKALARFAKSLHLEVLLEVHSEQELETSLNEYVDLVGVNNRDLTTFKVDLQHSLKMVNRIPKEIVKISESGIKTPEDVVLLRQAGYKGFLMGEIFMKAPAPGQACKAFINQLQITHKAEK
ncbi:MAG: indole-3-glycerol phosphate synthase TrpC [Bacteroidota bacterium]